MKLTRLHVENFGKLSNFDMDFSDGLNELCKENGWGKSTLTTFIKAIFYSMPSKKGNTSLVKTERGHFYPWQEGKFGGFIEYQTEEGNFRLTRYFGKTESDDFVELKNLDTLKIIDEENETIGEKLFGLGRETFEITAFFPQLKFASTTNAQITANLTGVDKFQNDLENIKNAKDILDKKIAAVKKEKIKNEEIDLLKKQLNENDNIIFEKTKENEDIKERIESLKEGIKNTTKEISIKNEEFENKNKQFLERQKIEKCISEETEKYSKALYDVSALKDKKIQKSDTKPQKSGKKWPVLTSIPFILIFLVLIYFMLTNMLPVIFGLLCVMTNIALLIIAEFFVMKKAGQLTTDETEQDDTDSQIQNLQSKIDLSTKTIALLKVELQQYKDADLPDKSQIDGLMKSSNEQELEKSKLESAFENNLQTIDRLIEDNDRLNSELDNIKTKNEEISQKLYALTKTKEYLSKAQENVSTRFIIPVNKDFKELFSQFNLKQDFSIDTEWKVKQNTNYGTKDFEYSSQGLQDIISFCQRVNLVKQIFKKEKPLIILDDSFVNLDDQNIKIAKKIVKDLAKDYQILYICCNEKSRIK